MQTYLVNPKEPSEFAIAEATRRGDKIIVLSGLRNKPHEWALPSELTDAARTKFEKEKKAKIEAAEKKRKS